MKAAVYTAYGGPNVVQITDVPAPVPTDDDVLIRVRAAALNPHDWRIMRGSPYAFRTMYGGFRAPKARPGRDISGDIEAVGKNVERFKPGDAVFGFCHGGLAEYACTSQLRLAHKPENASYEEAACVPVAGITALQALRDHGHLRAGQAVVINGAAGGVGTFAVQMAKTLGANVSGVCSTRNVEFVRSIGADRVVDYTETDFTKADQRYDLVVDCVGNHSLAAYGNVLHPRGTCVVVGAPKELPALRLLGYLVVPKLLSRVGTRKFVTFITKANDRDLPAIAALIRERRVRPVIDSCYELRDVAQALAHLEEGHARGKVVVTLRAAG
jgi:NADPH:quinone reductase-like Zn-dependent oxidoreductase